MKLPRNFARRWVKGNGGTHQGHGDKSPSKGWVVRVNDRGAFIPLGCIRYPGAVRQRLETVLGIKGPPKSQEEIVTHKSRVAAAQTRAGRLAYAARKKAGKNVTLPWLRPRTLNTIRAEEQTLAIALKWQRMGEYKR